MNFKVYCFCINTVKIIRSQTKAEEIKKRWQEYTEELYKKDLHDPGNHDGVITNLEPDILECKVKWAFGKGQFSFQSQRKAMPKNAQTTAQLHSSHMLVK